MQIIQQKNLIIMNNIMNMHYCLLFSKYLIMISLSYCHFDNKIGYHVHNE